MNTRILTSAFALALCFAAVPSLRADDHDSDGYTFDLVANPQFAKCLANPASHEAPTAHVTVVKGKLNDTLVIDARNIKPGLAFDLFTVQNSFFLNDGTKNPGFLNFGLAWYQSDLEANYEGRAKATIRTILLNQIFGFDPNHALPPTNTFHVGFWFNNPNDAAACGFDLTKPTPFNGEHKAGPMAMMSVPQKIGLGPLCTSPVVNGSSVSCNP